jgi:3-phosphoshikimate 1-carboxyvinyltransferase
VNLYINPGKPLIGEIELPGDKSISHRAALFAALAQGESRIENFLEAGVTEVMLRVLGELGIEWEIEDGVLTIHGRGLSGLKSPTNILNCGNSGTTLRLLLGALTAANITAVLDGSKGLRRRPMTRVVEPLISMGALVTATQEGTAPIELSGRPEGSGLSGRKHVLSVASAQVKTAILLAGLCASGGTVVIEPGLSRDHTERMLAGMGVQIDSIFRYGHNFVTLEPVEPDGLPPLNIRIPGDISSAAFLIVSGIISPGSDILIKNVGLNSTRIGLIDVLKSMGAKISLSQETDQWNEPVGNIHVQHSDLKGVQVSGEKVVRMIDEFPIFAVAAAYADGETEVREAMELRYKESDRIGSICAQLRAVGVQVEELKDGFVIQGSEPPRGGVAHAAGDHRLAMSMTVCGLASQDKITVNNADIFMESFPGFGEALMTLGAELSYD